MHTSPSPGAAFRHPIRRILFLAAVAAGLSASAATNDAGSGLTLPPGMRFVNGTGGMPLTQGTFKAPGFTSQGFIEIRADAGPHVCLVGLNASETALTLRSSYRTAWNAPLARVTYAQRNAALGLQKGPEETVVAPWQFYVSDPLTLTVKAGDRLYLRTFVPLAADTAIGCGVISGSDPRPDGRWSFGNCTGAVDRTMDADLEASFRPSNDLLCVPFLLAGENVAPGTPFVVILGDSLTAQLGSDDYVTWSQALFRDFPRCNMSACGDALNNVLTPEGEIRGSLNRARFAVLAHATDVVNFYGHNDLGNGVPLAAMLNLEARLCARPELAQARKWRCTLTPFTHNRPGADWKTLTEADQTPDRYSPVIVEFNREIRARYAKYGYSGILDFGAALATGPDSVYWKPGIAGDGTHIDREAPLPLLKVEAAKIIPQIRPPAAASGAAGAR